MTGITPVEEFAVPPTEPSDLLLPAEVRAFRTGRWVRMVPVEHSHIDFLYSLVCDEWTGPRWRYLGAVPPREQFQTEMSQGLLAQFVVVERATGQPVGHVQAYNPDINAGVASLAAAMAPAAHRTGIGIEAGYLFAQYLFQTFRLRKLYIEVPSFNLPLLRGAIAAVGRLEGVLKGHVYYDGRFWDRHVVAIYREDLADKSMRDVLRQRDLTRPDRRPTDGPAA